MLRIAIVGLGPWGLCAFERLVSSLSRCSEHRGPIELHLIEPSRPGTGIYDVEQPDFLLMNNSCAEISIYPREASSGVSHRLGLFAWATAQGYRWRGDDCRINASGAPIRPEDFLPRRVMGEYLEWVFRSLLGEVPEHMVVRLHVTHAVDVVACGEHEEAVHLADGTCLNVHHVILTIGHVPNQSDADSSSLASAFVPNPKQKWLDSIPPQATVLIAGMGLVGVDLVATLTLGRGGRFQEKAGRLTYVPSGREPKLHLLSRSGLPYRSKTAVATQYSERKQPIVFTKDVIDRLTTRGRAAIDFRAHVLPLLLCEMTARYYIQSAFLSGGQQSGSTMRERFQAAFVSDSFQRQVDRAAAEFGRFDAAAMLFGPERRYASSVDYEDFVCSSISEELEQSGYYTTSAAHPLTAAAEAFRVLRDSIRTVVEYGRLTSSSYKDFHGDLRSRINRLVAGPPAWRLRQIVALRESEILRIPYGPAPIVRRTSGPSPAICVSSSALEQPFAHRVDFAIRGYLEDPSIETSKSSLVTRLYRSGRLRPLSYDETSVGSLDITPSAHPIDNRGVPQKRLWVFGAITEGVRYFTHYIPSPHRGVRAFEDIASCVNEILADS